MCDLEHNIQLVEGSQYLIELEVTHWDNSPWKTITCCPIWTHYPDA